MEVLGLTDEVKLENGEIKSWVPEEGIASYILKQYEIDYNDILLRRYYNLDYIKLLEEQAKHEVSVNLNDFIIRKVDNFVYYDTKKISAKLAKQIIEGGDFRDMGLQYKTVVFNAVINLVHTLNSDPYKPFNLPTYLQFLEAFVKEDLNYLKTMEVKYPYSLSFGQTPREAHCEWHFRTAKLLLLKVCQSEEYVKKAVEEVVFENE